MLDKELTTIPLLLFAKAPIAGKVKTRLQSDCSAEEASEVAKVLLEESIIKATQSWPGRVYLSVALDIEHDFLQLMLKRYAIELVSQSPGDLGEKMHCAFDSFGYPAAIMGCDAPHISSDCLSRAYESLSKGDPVLGPSDDGGYYFIGLVEPQKALFVNIDWGTSSVLSSTLEIAKQNNVKFELLEPLNDVDEWEDLVNASKHLPSLRVFVRG